MEFKDYQGMKYALTFSEMQEIHADMLSEIANDEGALEIYRMVLTKSIRYTRTRAEWGLMTVEEKMEGDPARTALHDSLIINFDKLSRYLKLQGKKAAWRDRLGSVEDDPAYRKRIGDMADYLTFVEALLHR